MTGEEFVPHSYGMQIETLGDAWYHDARLWMACAYGKREGLKTIRECWYRKDLDLETLICTRGRDFPLAMLATRLRCPRCGSRQIRVVWNFPTLDKRNSAAAGPKGRG
ncbi:hypothetical protein [Chelativorans oligotrophicus]|uniref:hypothetical protein n=1 Tax=Chelativorans oligotrophicus TaxID=449974 RepID=UPI001FE7CAD3|nr:hypothetical protein [Chelativorans oligotrophicus]